MPHSWFGTKTFLISPLDAWVCSLQSHHTSQSTMQLESGPIQYSYSIISLRFIEINFNLPQWFLNASNKNMASRYYLIKTTTKWCLLNTITVYKFYVSCLLKLVSITVMIRPWIPCTNQVIVILFHRFCGQTTHSPTLHLVWT